MNVERSGDSCIAIQLHPLVQMLKKASIEADEKKIREFNTSYGKPYVGNQHFLDPSSISPKPIRNKSYDNTKHAKFIFIPHQDVGDKKVNVFLFHITLLKMMCNALVLVNLCC